MDFAPSSSASTAPHQPAAIAAVYGVSRKSGRRGDLETYPESTPMHATSSLPPPPPLVALDSPLWGTSLSPRGYTAPRRSANPETAQQQQHHPPGSAAHADAPTQQRDYRWKRRRTEQVSFASLHTEVFMYLDAAAAMQQQDPVTPPLSQGSGAEEDAGVHRAAPSVQPTLHTPSPPSSSSASFAFLPVTSQYSSSPTGAPSNGTSTLNAGPAARVAAFAPLSSVDAAVADALRVLRACWEYRGAPHDAFEPVRLLSPITVHLLTVYGHHTITHDGAYVVLRGGAEQLPWVGCLYGILQSYLCRHHHHHSGSSNNNSHCQERHESGEGETAAPPLAGISRVLLLNCHSFGWLDHVGTDEYERSHRRLYQAREALTSLLEDVRYAALGCPSACPACSSTTVGGDATTSVLLGDTIVMEGGAPSLGLASSANTFTAHYQYGRGIACCVPEARLPWHTTRPGAGGVRAGSRAGLCAHHRASLVEAVRRPGNVRWSTRAGEELAGRGASSYGGQVLSPPSPLFPSTQPLPHAALGGGMTAAAHFPPVCCGTCRAAGVLGQALLLGPTGPLLIHLQFEEREWLEAAAPLLQLRGVDAAAAAASHGGGSVFGQSRQGACLVEEIGAVCPAPLVNTASLRTDPAAALAAVLYAQMQGHGSAALLPPPLTSIPGGGAVPLAEFVEWLVRLLHAPPPALVVEWHSSPSSAAARSDGSPACASPTREAPGASSPCPPCVAPPPTPSAEQRASPPCAPLGLSVLPRQPVVPQLLETYADVMATRNDTRAFTVQSARSTGGGSGGVGEAHRGQPSSTSSVGGVRGSLRSSLASASAQVVEADQVLPAWVLAARDGLRPCEVTTYFDGVERPLVLSKGLEVVTEGERYVSATSVVTSLQFRARPSGGGLGGH